MCDTDELTILLTDNGEFVALCVASSAVSPIPFQCDCLTDCSAASDGLWITARGREGKHAAADPKAYNLSL